MAVLVLPVKEGVLSYRYAVQLEGVTYGISLRFNRRDKHWYMDLEDEDGTAIRAGIKLVTNFPLLRTGVSLALPPGELVVLAPTGTADPGEKDLGETALLLYLEAG